ncbi:hypothetical protein Gotur_014412 [Gossypium turneri]
MRLMELTHLKMWRRLNH